jgi:oleandomycin transport system ATP-binding protein
MTDDSGARMSYVIEAEGLAKRFGDTQALARVDIAAERGSVLALLGPNGAGKTTAVRVLATFLKPDAGHARICGYDVVADGAGVGLVSPMLGAATMAAVPVHRGGMAAGR